MRQFAVGLETQMAGCLSPSGWGCWGGLRISEDLRRELRKGHSFGATSQRQGLTLLVSTAGPTGDAKRKTTGRRVEIKFRASPPNQRLPHDGAK